VTTVIPTYRRPQLLRRAIDSALNQSRPEGIVAVFDDASGDETESVVREIMARDGRVTYHRHESNLGLTGNFSFALAHVETPYFSILSNDDMLLPRFYEAGLSALESHPEAAFAATQVIHVDDRERVLRLHFPWHPGIYTPPDGLLKLIAWGAPAWAGIMFRSSLLTELGNLDPLTDTLIDYDFQVRIAARKPYVVDPTPGAVFFHRRASISGEARLDGTWPGWQRLMANLANDRSVPADARDEGLAILKQQLIVRLHGVGVVSSRQSNFSDARQAADLLESKFDRKSQADRVRRFASLYEKLPLLGRVHAKYSEWRQPYERTGWSRRPMTLARMFSASVDPKAVRTPAVWQERR
jgi:Glycosyl transferase family 2